MTQKWEYMTAAVPVADLPALGAIGWELVAIDSGIMFFKRPLVEQPAEAPVKSKTAA